MSDSELAKVTAEYVFKNRENGWLKYALQVLAAEPYLRQTVIFELCEDVKEELENRLDGYNVWVELEQTLWSDDAGGSDWFSVTVLCEDWGDWSVTLSNWKEDASQIAISVYGDGESKLAAAITDQLTTLRQPWTQKRHPDYVWNIWSHQKSWRDPYFLQRVADATTKKGVVAEVAKEIAEVVELVDDVLSANEKK